MMKFVKLNPIGKKAYVGKAMDLILLIVFSVVGIFLVYTFFFQATDAATDEQLEIVGAWQTSDELISILHAPITANGDVSLTLYSVLASSSVEYGPQVIKIFDGLFGEERWAISICSDIICKLTMQNNGDGCHASSCEVDNIISSYNYHLREDLALRTPVNTIKENEVVKLINSKGEDVYLHFFVVRSIV